MKQKQLFFLLANLSFSSLYSTQAEPKCSWYTSQFVPTNELANKVLTKGQILGPDEHAHQMIERVAGTIAIAELEYNELRPKKLPSTSDFIQQLGKLMDEGAIVFSTPILTNAGRFIGRPLSACAMPPVDLKSDPTKIKQLVDQYHQDGMGTGYDLSDAENPIAMLKYLNAIAVDGARGNKEQRPVGNMAILSVDSPYIEQFIAVKIDADKNNIDWKFNLSVNVTDAFMQAVEMGKDYTLQNGRIVSARELLLKMAAAAHDCGDPGLVSLERLNADNPTPSVGRYQCTAPCAEVGLAPGETCIFGYINLLKLVSGEQHPVDFERLRSTVTVLTRALDNLLELSIRRYAAPASKSIMQAKRKIGIGICGYADMLIALSLSYQDAQARALLQDILNFISYTSKQASIALAEERGSFTAIAESRYMDEAFIMNKYGALNTPHVTHDQWKLLATKIKETKLLRHASTTALPPTGRSALIIGASTGIEPLFTLCSGEMLHPLLSSFLKQKNLHENHELIQHIRQTGRMPKNCLPRNFFVTATEIAPEDHLAVVMAAQTAIDEAISKTINLPNDISQEQIMAIYKRAYAAGLKGISVYRDNSRQVQPRQLSHTDENDHKQSIK